MYFILETKGDTSLVELCTREQLKIHCGKKHFEALEDGNDHLVVALMRGEPFVHVVNLLIYRFEDFFKSLS